MRAAQGMTIGFLPLLLATAAATTSSADPGGIPEFDISTVHPICDPLQEECISSDEQVQDEIIAGLEADDEVTGTCSGFRTGVAAAKL